MAIPALNEIGLLPAGVHACTFDELHRRFGGFQESDSRPTLSAKLRELIVEMKASGLFVALVINGSFTTAKPNPADVDLIVVLPPISRWKREVTATEYNLLSRRRLRRRFGFDVLLAADGDVAYEGYVEFFGRVRDEPLVRKGMLRIEL